MKPKWLVAMTAGILLISTVTRAADTVRAFGLEFAVISNAVMAIDEVYPFLHVEQINGPNCEGYGTGTNEVVTNMPFGVSVHLGEAQSGVYIYPDDAGCRQDDMSMWGNAYGNVNGETNRLISSIKGTRVSWGNYSIQVDLTPLGATSYTYQVWSYGTKTLHATNRGAFSGINTLNLEDYDPRVNPFFVSEAGPGAIIEFPRGTQFILDDESISGAGDRIMIIAEGATNQVNYVSRVDVFGSANLPAFAINDARIGMFGRPHKALGGVNFTALNGRLTAGPFEGGVSTNGPMNGVLVDFKNGAVSWVVQTEPFAFQQPDAFFLLSASGLGSDRPYGRYWGPAGLTKSNGVLHLSADSSGLDTSNSVLQVFQSNVLSGSIYGANGTILATLAETNPLVTGWAVTTQSLSISITEPTRLTGHDGTILEGDRFEFAPHESAVRIAYVTGAPVLAQGIPGFTIVSEFTEEARRPEPRIQIERAATGLMVSWPYLGGFYGVLRADLTRGPIAYLDPEYRDFRSYILLNPTNAMGFISLRHYYWYYSTP